MSAAVHRDRPESSGLLVGMSNPNPTQTLGHAARPGRHNLRWSRLVAFVQAHPEASDSSLGVDDLRVLCASSLRPVLQQGANTD